MVSPRLSPSSYIFFLTATATTEIYTLSLHDALPIYKFKHDVLAELENLDISRIAGLGITREQLDARSEEHTSELQSQSNLVCRLLLEKKNKPTRRMLSRPDWAA